MKIAVAFIDFKKAFDSVSHTILERKLEFDFGFSGSAKESSQYQKKTRFFKNRARKVLPKLRWGSKKHSKESGSRVFA